MISLLYLTRPLTIKSILIDLYLFRFTIFYESSIIVIININVEIKCDFTPWIKKTCVKSEKEIQYKN